MPTYRVDWQKILTKIDAQGLAVSDLVLLAVPIGGREILASIIGDRLEWPATYRTGDHESNDWDELEAFGNQIIKGLWDGIMLADLLALMQQILDAIPAGAVCCDSYAGTAMIDPELEIGEGDPPDEYAGVVVDDWADYQQWVCGAARGWIDMMADSLDKIENGFDTGVMAISGLGILVAIFAFPGIGWAFALSITNAAGIWLALQELASYLILGDAADDLRTGKTDLANTILCAGSAEQAAIDVRLWITANLDALGDDIMQLFDIEQNMIGIYLGEAADGTPLNVEQDAGCSDCIAFGEYTYEWDSDVEGWLNFGTTITWVADGGGRISAYSDTPGTYFVYRDPDGMGDDAGYDPDVQDLKITKISFDWIRPVEVGVVMELKVKTTYNGVEDFFEVVEAATDPDTSGSVSLTNPGTEDGIRPQIQIYMRTVSGGASNEVQFDNFHFEVELA